MNQTRKENNIYENMSKGKRSVVCDLRKQTRWFLFGWDSWGRSALPQKQKYEYPLNHGKSTKSFLLCGRAVYALSGYLTKAFNSCLLLTAKIFLLFLFLSTSFRNLLNLWTPPCFQHGQLRVKWQKGPREKM